MPPFAYQPFNGAPYAASIGELIARSAEAPMRAAELTAQAQSRAAEISGNASADAWRTIGQIPMQIQQQQDARQTRQLRAQEIAARTTAAKEHTDQLADAKRQRIVSVVGSLAKGAADPAEFLSRVDDLVTLGSVPKDVGAHLKQTVMQAGPEGWEPLKGRYVDFAAQLAKPVTLAEGAKAVNPVSGETLAENPKYHAPTSASLAVAAAGGDDKAAGALDLLQAPTMAGRDETARHNTELERIANLTAGRAEAAQKETARHNKAMEALRGQQIAKGAGDVTELSPQGLDAAALNYAKTGTLPPLGMGDKNTRKLIINRAAEMMPGLDIASAKADFAANQASLTQLQKQRDAIGAFENTAKKNMDVFLAVAKKAVDTGSPLLNTPVRVITGKMLGSTDQAAYDAARAVLIPEIARIVTNPNLTGVLSDSAREEIAHFNPENATLKQTVRVMELLKQDMGNRIGSLDDQITGIKARIKKAQTPDTPKDEAKAPAIGTEGVVSGKPAIWKTVDGVTGWWAK